MPQNEVEEVNGAMNANCFTDSFCSTKANYTVFTFNTDNSPAEILTKGHQLSKVPKYVFKHFLSV